MSTNKKKIKIFPLYCRSRLLSITFSVSLSVCFVCVGVSVRLSAFFVTVGLHHARLLCCQNKTGNFVPFLFFFFFYFRQMADSLMLSDLVSVVYCLAPGCFCQVTEQVNCDSYSMVCNGAALLFSSNRKAKLAGSQ